MSKEILDFIRVFNSSPSIEFLFTNCACYWFAEILHKRFSNSFIVYNPSLVHFATKIRGVVYDIRGIIEDDSEYVDWEDYSSCSADVDMIIDSCINLKID